MQKHGIKTLFLALCVAMAMSGSLRAAEEYHTYDVSFFTEASEQKSGPPDLNEWRAIILQRYNDALGREGVDIFKTLIVSHLDRLASAVEQQNASASCQSIMCQPKLDVSQELAYLSNSHTEDLKTKLDTILATYDLVDSTLPHSDPVSNFQGGDLYYNVTGNLLVPNSIMTPIWLKAAAEHFAKAISQNSHHEFMQGYNIIQTTHWQCTKKPEGYAIYINEPTEPGLLVSLIPIYGSVRSMYYNYHNDKDFWLAVDIVGVMPFGGVVGKGGKAASEFADDIVEGVVVHAVKNETDEVANFASEATQAVLKADIQSHVDSLFTNVDNFGVVVDQIKNATLTSITKSSPNFIPPINPPQLPNITNFFSTAELAESGKGVILRNADSVGNANTIRIMMPTADYPNGYFVVRNANNDPINLLTGVSGAAFETHIPLPEGVWPQIFETQTLPLD